MRLRALREELLRALSNPMNQRTFEQAKHRYPVLAGVKSPYALVAMLGKDSAADFTRKDEVLRALVHEYQHSPWPRLWISILSCALLPMLMALRSHVRCGDEQPDELDSQLLFAFHETVAGYPLARRSGSVAAGLKWDTRKRYLGNLVKAQDARDFQQDLAARAKALVEPGADRFEPSEFMGPPEGPPPWDGDDRAEMRAVLDTLVADGVVTREDADLVWITRIGKQSAAEVARRASTLDLVATSREMERLRRRRSRAEKKIFEALGRFSHSLRVPFGHQIGFSDLRAQ